MSAGTNRDAETPLSDELIEWADYIFVMERPHRKKLQDKHRAALKDKRLVVLDIPDGFELMDPNLIHMLNVKMSRWIPTN
ncbi:phosphotyrosine protein phosphatase [Erythrobacter sp. Alg231-14]|uniref:phosphotyrosine protein phosphatase n=1 Tax=Erythrobacter sp. Alg231-14 TaxID=1922225 RepID=UPI00307C6295